ncbi:MULTISPECIES: FAD-dependent thymidylate synthase [unclassified Marinobacter]|uniref:FAD-dependent thymidylate synthase n=1 Tax=unclassified Marinobacter TaxID=83889 RepID=UPI0012678FA4|nr:MULTISPECIES: FAD-dependent thymidylate synthase [unclassified Marinobacter]QFS87613.1 Thymidylate synthase ThyX [Marinobacter sp. THAF197a]QFT51398.1 Thymidylate synthase ThyX [Marinobacter sp. THAF39]
MIEVSNGFVQRVEHDNDDLTVVNAARVSFAKTSSELDGRDIKLIKYLADHDHWTPFSHVRIGLRLDYGFILAAQLFNELGPLGVAGAQWHLNQGGGLNLNMSLYGWAKLLECPVLHRDDRQAIINGLLRAAEYSTMFLLPEAEDVPSNSVLVNYCDEELDDDPRFNFVTFRLKMPIAIARQWFKHQVGLTRNEVSRRYVSDEPEFFEIEEWRGAPTNGAKQGSSGVVTRKVSVGSNINMGFMTENAKDIYAEFMADGVCPEQARMVLPQAMLTEFWETGSLADYARICKLRLDPHAQKEVRLYAQAVDEILTNSPDLASIWAKAKEKA